MSAQYPEKLKELQAAFMEEAIKYNVLPLDDRAQERFNATLAGRPEYMGGRTSLALYPGMIAMKENAFIDVKNRSSSITAELESGGSGVIVAQGGSHSGWSLYVKDGRARVCLQLPGRRDDHHFQRAPAGRTRPPSPTILPMTGGGKPGAGGTGTTLDQRQAGRRRQTRAHDSIHLRSRDRRRGLDLYSPVTTAYAKGDNEFTGKIKKVTIAVK